MTSTAIRQIETPTNRAGGLATAAIRRPLCAAFAWVRRWESRRQLESLTPEQLHDVGLDPETFSRGPTISGDPLLNIRLASLR